MIIFCITITLSRLLAFVCRKWLPPGTPRRTYEEGVTLVIWTFERKRQEQQTAVIAVARVRGRIRQSSSCYGNVPTFDGSAQINPLPRQGKTFGPGWIRADGLFGGIIVAVKKKTRKREISARARDASFSFLAYPRPYFCRIESDIKRNEYNNFN